MSSSPPPGVLLAFEGIDGSGKSTQARRVADWLEGLGLEVVRTREPTDGPWGRRIRESSRTGRMSPEAESAAFIEDRRQHVAELIAPALARGAVVVVDRYYDSTVAYQGARGLDPQALLAANRAFAPQPHRVYLVDVAPEVGLARIHARGGADLFENLPQLTRAREIFLSLRGPHVVTLDGALPPDDVFAAIVIDVMGGPLRAVTTEAQPAAALVALARRLAADASLTAPARVAAWLDAFRATQAG